MENNIKTKKEGHKKENLTFLKYFIVIIAAVVGFIFGTVEVDIIILIILVIGLLVKACILGMAVNNHYRYIKDLEERIDNLEDESSYN